MKRYVLIQFILLFTIDTFGQVIKISNRLTLLPLTDQTFVHTCDNSNGLVFINEEQALLISTPDSDIETQNLIDWVVEEKGLTIIGHVIDRWHPDAMEGLDVVHKNGIKSYSYELTRQIATEKGLPVPQIGFDPKTEIQIGNARVICHFLGAAHTRDGIVVWIPDEKILFGGNEIRNYNGWVGNIGDAILTQWSETALRVKNEYGSAKIVVPGHGKYGGIELIDYTIKLYESCKGSITSNDADITLEPTFKTCSEFYISAESELTRDGKRILKNSMVVAQDSTKYVTIESPYIEYQPEQKRINSETGRLKIYDKTIHGEKLRTDISYNNLIVFKKNDSVGLRVILETIGN